MTLRALLAAAVLSLGSAASHATPQAPDATDMWFNSAESGWGLNVIHQGDTLFATLFVFGPDGQPTWYVASNLTGSGRVYSGPLYASTGTFFGAPAFDAASSTRTQVGAMTLDLGNDTLDYTVNGVHVAKRVSRFTFRPTDLTGLHRAFVYKPPPTPGAAQVARDLERFAVTDDGTHVSIATSSDSETECTYDGSHGQDGQYETVSGTYSCGPGGSAGSGAWSMRVDPTPDGFVGTFSDGRADSAAIGAALASTTRMEGTGWRNGMWFAPSESGWGLNVIEQGDTLFATLFVYDGQGRPHWYVASALAQSGSTSDGSAINTGPLYEATGPWFGASSFNPSAVARRQVGTMSFQVRGPGTAVVSYSVDGVPVTKSLAAFTFARNDTTGTYQGQISGMGGHDPTVITIDDRGGPFSMHLKAMYGVTCDYTGMSQQVGQALHASGNVTCGGGGSASFVLRDLLVDREGVTGHVDLSGVSGFVQDGEQSFNLGGGRAN